MVKISFTRQKSILPTCHFRQIKVYLLFPQNPSKDDQTQRQHEGNNI